ncbi:MAG: 3-dehydroquinate synthase [Candidatus Caldatribacteriota bacterium]
MENIDLVFERKYLVKIVMGQGILNKVKTHLIPFLSEPRVVIITNPLLKKLYADSLTKELSKYNIEVHTILVADGEKTKSLNTAKKIFDSLIECKVNRSTTLISLGGGVIGDLGGFIAATFMRGLPLIHIPTTLLAQIDSSIGGKVAINHAKAKNTIGSFYHPGIILTDSRVLQSLPIRQIKNGLVEAIKIAIISSSSFFDWLENNIELILKKDEEGLAFLVKKAIQLKTDLILKDPWENNINNQRKYLNLGHTIGHVWEVMGGYNRISHGEAVALGILMETKIAYELGICSEELQQRIKQIFSFLFNSLPPKSFFSLLFQSIQESKRIENSKINFATFWDILTLDKKNSKGEITFILPEKLGRVRLIDHLSREEIKNFLQEFISS